MNLVPFPRYSNYHNAAEVWCELDALLDNYKPGQEFYGKVIMNRSMDQAEKFLARNVVFPITYELDLMVLGIVRGADES